MRACCERDVRAWCECREIARCECGVETIVALLCVCDESTLRNTMNILRNMATTDADNKLKAQIIKSNLIPALIAPLCSPYVHPRHHLSIIRMSNS